MHGITAQCPKCGGLASVPDGLYVNLHKAVDQILRADSDPKSIPKLIVALNRLNLTSSVIEDDDVRISLERAGVPNAEAIAATAPAGKSDKKKWLGWLVAAIVYVWERFPETASNWIDFFTKVSEIIPT